MNMYIYELKSYFKSIWIWCLSLAGVIFLLMSFYPTMAADASLMEQVMANYPPELLKAFGMDSAQSLATLPGYFSFVYFFVQLCIAIQASNYGFSFLSVEERELTADFLMTRPVSRTKIIISKFLSALTALTLTNFVVWISVFLAFKAFNNGSAYDSNAVIYLLSSIVLFQLFFLSVGMTISVSVKKIRTVLTYSMGLAFGMYMLHALGKIIDSSLLSLISPFYHFEAEYFVNNSSYNVPLLLLNMGITLTALIVGYLLYLKRNISSV